MDVIKEKYIDLLLKRLFKIVHNNNIKQIVFFKKIKLNDV